MHAAVLQAVLGMPGHDTCPRQVQQLGRRAAPNPRTPTVLSSLSCPPAPPAQQPLPNSSSKGNTSQDQSAESVATRGLCRTDEEAHKAWQHVRTGSPLAHRHQSRVKLLVVCPPHLDAAAHKLLALWRASCTRCCCCASGLAAGACCCFALAGACCCCCALAGRSSIPLPSLPPRFFGLAVGLSCTSAPCVLAAACFVLSILRCCCCTCSWLLGCCCRLLLV